MTKKRADFSKSHARWPENLRISFVALSRDGAGSEWTPVHKVLEQLHERQSKRMQKEGCFLDELLTTHREPTAVPVIRLKGC